MKYIYHCFLVSFILIGLFSSCRKMDSTYRQFVVPGGLTYAGKITSPMVQSGNNRIKISWLRGADASVTHAKVFWNNYGDSLTVPVPAVGDTISAIISNLEEKPYTFMVRTYDNKGNVSIPVELLGECYGDKYQEFLVTRPVLQSENEDENLTIFWSNANKTGGAYATEVEYTNAAGQTATKRFSVDEVSSIIQDYKAGTTYRYRTEYRPGKSIDPFYSTYTTKHVSYKVPKAGLLVTADSFAATSQLSNGGGPPRFAFDDDVKTFWHTHHTPAPVPGFPHWLAVNLGAQYHVTRVELTCRPGVSNTFTAFTIQGSMDGNTWSNYGSFTLIQKDPTQSFDLLPGPAMRHVRIFATAGPNAYANLAEFSVFGYQ